MTDAGAAVSPPMLTLHPLGPTAGLDLESLRRFTTLEALLRYAHGQRPAWPVVEVVTQDEYSHDVVLAVDDRWVVFEAT